MDRHRSSSDQLYGIVDMGSNGIRFSISDLSPPTARCLPTVFQSRAAISLYDAQYSADGERGPIAQPVIDSVVAALARFTTACADFDVPFQNVHILATEATRTAPNSAHFRRQIKDATGIEVEMLDKETEGTIGAMGVASSISEGEGLVMDLGGGSTQLTWLIARKGGIRTRPQGSISLPYGAAALTRRLTEAEATGDPKMKETLAAEMRSHLSSAYNVELDMPADLRTDAQGRGGLTLYLSGGGFRGWGYLLMSQSSISPYPIPIINGFQVGREDFQDVGQVQQLAVDKQQQQQIFGVSKRRASQVPAVAFLIDALTSSIPDIKEIRFCQGGIREGYLFDMLSVADRARDPLQSVSEAYAIPSPDEIGNLLLNSIPREQGGETKVPSSIFPTFIVALTNLMFIHSRHHPSESAPVSALHLPLTGALTSTLSHGLSHQSRALLAVTLCHRWSSGAPDLPPPNDDLYRRLRRLLSARELWWAIYMGTMAKLVAAVYPAGRVRHGSGHGSAAGDTAGTRFGLRSEWVAESESGKKDGSDGTFRLTIWAPVDAKEPPGKPVTPAGAAAATAVRLSLDEAIRDLEKLGKKKHRIRGSGGEDGQADASSPEPDYWVRVKVDVESR